MYDSNNNVTYELKFDTPVKAIDVLVAVSKVDNQNREVVIDTAFVGHRPAIFVHDGNPPDWDPGERAGKIYLHLDYNGYQYRNPMEGRGTHFHLSGLVVTPELVKQVQAELSGR